MSKTGIWLVIAASLMVLGMVILLLTAHAVNWNFAGFSTSVYNKVDSEFDSISINTDTADIEFLPSDNGNCRVICYESEKVKHVVSVVDRVLTVSVEDGRKWYEHLNIGFRTPRLTVYLPKSEYALLVIRESTGDVKMPQGFTFGRVDISVSTGDVEWSASVTDSVKIKANTGDICVEDTSVGSLDLSVTTGRVSVSDVTVAGDVTVGVSTGKTDLEDVKCQNLISNGSTGDMLLEDVIAGGKFSIERSTGDVKFEECDAAEIFVRTDTGDIRGSLLTDKVFITKTDTGKIRVPTSSVGGRCELITDTGDIYIRIGED